MAKCAYQAPWVVEAPGFALTAPQRQPGPFYQESPARGVRLQFWVLASAAPCLAIGVGRRFMGAPAGCAPGGVFPRGIAGTRTARGVGPGWPRAPFGCPAGAPGPGAGEHRTQLRGRWMRNLPRRCKAAAYLLSGYYLFPRPNCYCGMVVIG